MDEYQKFQETLRGELQRRGIPISKAPKQDSRIRNKDGSYAPHIINQLVKTMQTQQANLSKNDPTF